MPMIVIRDGSAVYSSHHAHEGLPLKPESDNNFAPEPAFCTTLQGVCPRASQSCPGAAQQHGTDPRDELLYRVDWAPSGLVGS